MDLPGLLTEVRNQLGIQTDLTQVMLAFALLMGRVLPVIMLTPFLGGESVPSEVKLGLGVMLGLVLYPLLIAQTRDVPVSPLIFIALMLKELFIGLSLTMVVNIIFDAANVAGGLIDVMSGTNQAQLFVPQLGQQVTLFANLNLQLTTVTFLTLNGHRTGYTGEDGFELYFEPAHGAAVWEGLLRAGEPHGLELVGLGARDTLRLEMGYMLYGNDIDDTTTPLEAGLGWTVKLAKGEFHGSAVLAKQKAEGLKRRLVGFQLEGRRVPRHGMNIVAGGRTVGQVTSGTFSPSLERPIGMGYVESALAANGTALEIQAGSSLLAARVTARPFYTRGSHRS